MNKIVTFVLACSMSLVLTAPALAHHSAAAFNTQQEIKVSGTVTEYRFRNPHVYMVLQVKQPDGSTVAMEVEAGAASVLNPLGFTKNSVAAGDVVTIVGNPARVRPERLMLGKDLYKSDGTYYPLNIGSRSVYAGRDETATTIAGTWFAPRTEFNAFLGGARKWPVTEKAKAGMGTNDPTATTQKDCIPIGAPALMFYPVANTITVQRDRVVMNVDWMDTERVIYLDGRKPPAASQTSLHGFSVGRWEGDTLVIDTIGFNDRSWILAYPHTEQLYTVERYRRVEYGRLEIVVVFEDPGAFSRPWTMNLIWYLAPGEELIEFVCENNRTDLLVGK